MYEDLFNPMELQERSFIHAVSRNDIDSVKRFIDSGMPLDILGDFDLSLVHFGVTYPECLQILIDAGAPLNIRDIDGHTALISCMIRNRPVSFRKLIDAKASLDIVDNYGQTALIRLCIDFKKRYAHITARKMIITLIENGAQLDITDIHGKTALDYCETWKEGYLRLIKAGASFNVDNVKYIKEIRDMKRDQTKTAALLTHHLSPDIVDHITLKYLYSESLSQLPPQTKYECTIS